MMKKLKIIFGVIIAIALMVVLISTSKALPGDSELNLEDIPTHSGNYGFYYHLSNFHMSGYNNVYCVQKGYSVVDDSWYYKRAEAYIDGDTVIFQEYDNKGVAKYNKFQSGTSGEHNRILGAILCGESWDYGPYSSTSGNPLPNTDSQKSLWGYWGTWISKSGAGNYGFSGKDTGSVDSRYYDIANEKAFEYTVIFLESYKSGHQNLILVNRWGETDIPTEITVTKVWKNDTEADRPDSIAIDLYTRK